MLDKNKLYAIDEAVKALPAGEIFTGNQIAHKVAYKQTIFRFYTRIFIKFYLKYFVKTNKIQQIDKNLYYRTELTAFGSTPPDYYQYAIKYFTKRQKTVIGYESGTSFLNRLGLSTLIPKAMEITTNNYRKRLVGVTNIIVKRPVTKITNENWRYLQVIDMLHALKESHIDFDNPEIRIKILIREYSLDINRLINYTKKYYAEDTLQEVIRFAKGSDTL